MADDIVLPIPNLALPQNLFVLSTPSLAHLHDTARKELFDGIKADRLSLLFFNPSILLMQTIRNDV
jgi:26S proteasome regulatory subunit N7